MHAAVGLAHAGVRRFPGFMSDESDDDDLMADVQGARGARRDDAFRELVRRHAASVQTVVRSVVGRGEGAEDVTQEVFLRVYEARERYEPGRAPFRAWLLRIARNSALNARRQGALRKTSALEDAGDVAAAEPGPAGAFEQKLDLEAVRDAVDRLPSSERELIALRFQGGLSYEEIQAVTGSGTAALKQKTWRALQRLRALLGAEEETA
jgi:RNA polymerase sigma-70 factor (ECF subfamily)